MIAIRPNHLQAWIQQQSPLPEGQLPIVLDVRESWEWDTARVKPEGFELRHMPMRTVPARLDELPTDRPIACLCHHGARSAQVTQFLLNQGYTDVVNLAGGIDAWSSEVDPTVPRY